MTVLSELIEHHVEEEETEMFKVAEELGEKRLAELGSEMANAIESRHAAPTEGSAMKALHVALLGAAISAAAPMLASLATLQPRARRPRARPTTADGTCAIGATR